MQAKLGTGKRFSHLTHELAGKGAKDPKALAAWIGREKYGAGRMASLASHGKAEGGDVDDHCTYADGGTVTHHHHMPEAGATIVHHHHMEGEGLVEHHHHMPDGSVQIHTMHPDGHMETRMADGGEVDPADLHTRAPVLRPITPVSSDFFMKPRKAAMRHPMIGSR